MAQLILLDFLLRHNAARHKSARIADKEDDDPYPSPCLPKCLAISRAPSVERPQIRKLENRDSVELDLVKGFFGHLEFVVKSWSSTTLSLAEDMINDILDTAHDDLTDLIPDSCLRARARFRQLPCHRAKRQRLE